MIITPNPRYKAIVKTIAGQRYLLGFERFKASHKYNEKLLLPYPLNLTSAVGHHHLKAFLADLWNADKPKPSWISHPLLRLKIELRLRQFRRLSSSSSRSPATKP